MPAHTYSMKNVVATVDGTKVTGTMDGDDVYAVEFRSEVATVLTGADGTSMASQSADESATITFRLKPNSPMHRVLHQKLKGQRAGNPRPFQIYINDVVSNEGGTGTFCKITSAPTMQFGQNATVREWVLTAGQWTPTIPYE